MRKAITLSIFMMLGIMAAGVVNAGEQEGIVWESTAGNPTEMVAGGTVTVGVNLKNTRNESINLGAIQLYVYGDIQAPDAIYLNLSDNLTLDSGKNWTGSAKITAANKTQWDELTVLLGHGSITVAINTDNILNPDTERFYIVRDEFLTIRVNPVANQTQPNQTQPNQTQNQTKPKPTEPAKGFIPGFEAAIVLSTILVAVIILRRR